jgi:hypothetical protein
MSFVAELTAPDDRTIRMVLREPFGLVIESLGKTGGNVAFMMPKRVADTDPNKQITEAIGSGPFIFKRDEWKAGEKAVYLRNPKYKPRNEPPVRLRRRQGGQGRSGRMDLDPRHTDPGERPAERRGRPDRGDALTTCCLWSRSQGREVPR